MREERISIMAQEFSPDEIWRKIQAHEKQERERIAQFGEIRAPLFFDFHGHKLVVAGNRIHYAPVAKWKTFPDFLFEYLAMTFSKEWGQAELSKPFEEQHPICSGELELLNICVRKSKKDKIQKASMKQFPMGTWLLF